MTDEDGTSYRCEIGAFRDDSAELNILTREEGKNELSAKITLFQGLPKGDKTELIIQKAVELGAAEIVPVEMKRTIVKVDAKKEASRNARYQAIAESAAKQSGRNRIPEVKHLMSMKEAVAYAKTFDLVLVPYEKAVNMAETREIIRNVPRDGSIAVFIGPEGGIEPSEIELLESIGGKAITLGKRILRTETAGLTILSVLMFELD